ncbi:MAG: hypothetical protein ACYDHB_12150 [Candidatus Dormibacteria bacterium]
MSGEPGPSPAPPDLPRLAPPPRGSAWRMTGLAGGLLGLLVVLRVATAHPVPSPSHQTPQGAVAGYLAALLKSDLKGTEAYLAPSVRGQAPVMFRDLKADGVRLVSPAVGAVAGTGTTVTVEAALEVCYRRRSGAHYTCELLAKQPLGLSPNFQCVYRGRRWYVTTLLEPQRLPSG